MAVFNKYVAFINDLCSGAHNLKTAVYRLALTNTAPTPATDTIWSAGVYPPPASANGYPAGGASPAITSAAMAGSSFKLVLTDTVFTATAGGIGPFRYVILYDSSAANKLVGFYDYGSTVSLNATDTFTVDFDDVNGVLTVT